MPVVGVLPLQTEKKFIKNHQIEGFIDTITVCALRVGVHSDSDSFA